MKHLALAVCSSVIALLLLSFPSKVDAQAKWSNTTVLASTLDRAPDGPGHFNFFANIALNDHGMVAFSGQLAGDGVSSTNSEGIYRADKFEVITVARGGQSLPDSTLTVGRVIEFPFDGHPPSINDSGNVAFRSFLRGPGTFLQGTPAVIRSINGELDIVVQLGEFPDFGNDTFNFDYLDPVRPRIDHFDRVFFEAAKDEGTAGSAAFLRSHGAAVEILAQEGDAAPGDVGVLSDFHHAAINGIGEITFSPLLQTGPPFSSSSSIVVKSNSSGLSIASVSGILAPDNPQELRFLRAPTINDAGQVAFHASLKETSDLQARPTGIYVATGNTLHKVALDGDYAPDNMSQLDFFAPRSAPSPINNNGQVLFSAFLSGDDIDSTNNFAIFRKDGSLTKEIVREGQVLPDGLTTIEALYHLEKPMLNDLGQVAFLATLLDDQDNRLGYGLFLYDDELGIQTIIREGSEMLGSTVTSIRFNDEAENSINSFNNLGQVAYNFRLANGVSGIALFTPPRLIPEPTTVSIALLSCAGFIMSTRRARRGR